MQEYLIRTSHRPRHCFRSVGHDPALERSAVCALAGSGSATCGAVAEDLQVDSFQGSAVAGVVPFWMDRIKVRGMPPVPGARSFPELNLRTYVRDPYSGARGFIFSHWTRAICWLLRWDGQSTICPTTGRRCRWSTGPSGNSSSIAGGFGAGVRWYFRRGTGLGRRASWLRAGAGRWSIPDGALLPVYAKQSRPDGCGRTCTTFPGLWKKRRRRLSRMAWRKRLGFSFPTWAGAALLAASGGLHWPAELVRPAVARRPVTVAVTPSG